MVTSINPQSSLYYKNTTGFMHHRLLWLFDSGPEVATISGVHCSLSVKFGSFFNFDLISVAFTMKDLRYKWNDGLNSVQISSDVSLPQFKVMGHRQKTIEAALSTGNYSRLALEIQFKRSPGYYWLMLTGAGLIALLPGLSVAADSRQMRLSISFISTVALIFLSVHVNSTLPKISYIKSIDVILGLWTLYAFLTFLCKFFVRKEL